MKKPIDAKLVFGGALGVFAAAAGLMVLQNQGLNGKRAQVVQLREKDREQLQIYSKLAQSKKDLDDLKAKLAHIEEGLPDAAYVPTMLKELETFGKQRGIEVTGVRPIITRGTAIAKDKGPASKKPYEPLDIELKGRGKYADLMNFVQTLNTFPKIVAVRTMTLAPPAAAKTEDRRLEITIGLRAFVFSPKQSTKASGGSV